MKRSTNTKAWNAKYIKQGMKLIFFSDSHLALHATKWTLGWMIFNLQVHLNPRWHLVIDRDARAAFSKQT